MQGSISGATWTPPTGTLGALTAQAYERAEAALPQLASLLSASRDLPGAPPFFAALRGPSVRVIGEVKRASPSKGAIAPGLDAVAQARRYVAGGAAAISVLTEPRQFGGSLADLAAVSAAISAPVIRKDFLVHPVQVWEARAHGAAAVLLIVRALDQDTLQVMMDTVRDAQIEALVEIRNEAELERALAVNARVIGVNNRNLETLVIDPDTAPRMIRCIPSDLMAVAESGMRDVSDVLPSALAGADAILVGSAISAAHDPESSVRALSLVPRHDRTNR